MRTRIMLAAALVAVLALTTPKMKPTADIPPEITTPEKVETRIGPLDFKDGMPSKETIAEVYDNLDFTHAFEAFVNTLQGVSIHALHKGLLSAGVMKRANRISIKVQKNDEK
jgi:hypothetical protein